MLFDATNRFIKKHWDTYGCRMTNDRKCKRNNQDRSHKNIILRKQTVLWKSDGIGFRNWWYRFSRQNQKSQWSPEYPDMKLIYNICYSYNKAQWAVLDLFLNCHNTFSWPKYEVSYPWSLPVLKVHVSRVKSLMHLFWGSSLYILCLLVLTSLARSHVYRSRMWCHIYTLKLYLKIL